ncbi:unnamed protein product [Toxocara canis]|uniref:BPI2 domain-containing protein n=1 Tax=Toxocara canis TaxID=6265 RepID=A0A183VAM5_TOXCA|nr:unnamed protein product [Toxocara canis]
MSGKIERTICAELTNALDMFLRNGIEQLSFRHSLTTGTILNNSLISKPLLSADGDLTTYHYGIVRGDSIPSTEITLLERYPYDVTYLVKPQLLDEILSTVYRRSLFDGSYKDDVEYNMSVECVKPPKVVLEGEGIILALEERLIAMKNAVLLLNDTFTVGLLLNALYSYRLQLFFQVLRTSNLAFLPEEVHQKFGSKLRQQWSSVVATYLRVPLPTAIGVLARNATLKIEKPFIVFGVDIYSPLYHNSKRSLS